MTSRKASLAALGRLSLSASTVSEETRTPFVTPSPLSRWHRPGKPRRRFARRSAARCTQSFAQLLTRHPSPHVRSLSHRCLRRRGPAQRQIQASKDRHLARLARYLPPDHSAQPTALQPWAKAASAPPPMRTRDSLPPNMAVGASAENTFHQSLHTGARRPPVAAHRASSSGRAAAAGALGSSAAEFTPRKRATSRHRSHRGRNHKAPLARRRLAHDQQ